MSDQKPDPGSLPAPEPVIVVQNENWRPREGQPTPAAPATPAPTYLPPNAKEPPKL